MIRELTLKLGPPGEALLVIEPGAVTVVVGPNKAGKTTFLAECSGLVGTAGCRADDNRVVCGLTLGLPQSAADGDMLSLKVWTDVIEPLFRRLSELDAVCRPTEAELRGFEGAVELLEVVFRMAATGMDAGERELVDHVGDMRRARALFEVIDDLVSRRHDGMISEAGWPFDHRDAPRPEEIVAAIRARSDTDIRRMVQAVVPWQRLWASLELSPEVKRPVRRAPIPEPSAIWPAVEALWQRGWLVLEAFAGFLLPTTTFLAGDRRLNMLGQQRLGSLLGEPRWPAEILFRSPERLEQLNALCRPVLDGYRLALDAITEPGSLRFVLTTGEAGPDRMSLTRSAAEFFAGCAEPTDFSRGMHAFVGLTMALITEDVGYSFIDEPEAFLHPSLARYLGRCVAELAAERGVQAFVATHSEHFLMGCVDAGLPLTIVRLHNATDGQFAWTLSADDVAEMMNDPLLRSSDVLQGVFCRHAVVVEGETDRAFYSEINLRLGDDGIDDVVWPTAFGKQSMHRIVELLRRVGVRTAAIVDIDVLTSGNDLKNLLKAQGVPDTTSNGMTTTQKQIASRLFAGGEDKEARDVVKKRLKRNGLEAFERQIQQSMRSLIRQLAAEGIFVVPVGEVEGWLRCLTDEQSPKKGSGWLVHIFEQMGRADRPNVEPGDDDVWRFIRDVRAWMTQPRG